MDFKPKYIRKTKGRVRIPKSVVKRAVNALTKGKKSISDVSRSLNISKSSVKRIRNKLKANRNQLPPNSDTRRIFSEDQETSIAQLIFELHTIKVKTCVEDVRKIAYAFALKQGLQQQVTAWKHNLASRDWIIGFFSRNPRVKKCICGPRLAISIQVPAPTVQPGRNKR